MFTQLIVSKLVRPGQPQVLVMDRTHWRLGRTDLNVLCVGLVHAGQLPYRRTFLTQALAYLNPSVCCLVADREFIGRAWFAFLLGFCPHSPTRQYVDHARRWSAALFGGLQSAYAPRHHPILSTDYTLWRLDPESSGHRPVHGERILLLTNRTDLTQVLALYGQRWTIETTFACLKSRGFNLEDTHLTHPQRLHLLLGLLAWTLLWALLVGEQLHHTKPIPIKKQWTELLEYLQEAINIFKCLECFTFAVEAFRSC